MLHQQKVFMPHHEWHKNVIENLLNTFKACQVKKRNMLMPINTPNSLTHITKAIC